MNLLSREQVLGADRLDVQEVDVPEWHGKVRVRGLDAEQFIEYERRVTDEDFHNLRASIVAAGAVDADNKPLFSQADVAALGKKAAKPIDRLFRAIIDLTGFTNADVEQAEKNSESGQA